MKQLNVKRWMVGILAGLASLVAQAGTITYFHNDLAGSPQSATNASGQVIWRESYRPYGERLTNSASATDNKVWFTSRRQDVDTGLVYMGARYYDPTIGRFVSMDPVGFDDQNLHSHNRYAYANNNPYRYSDPDGKSPALIMKFMSATGGSYGLGILADGLSQYAAFGSVDWGLAMESSAAKQGAAAGALAALPVGMPAGLGIKVVEGSSVAVTTFKTAHYGNRLEKVGVSVKEAEVAIGRDISVMRKSMEVNADVVGRKEVGGTLIEYRARLLQDGTVNVGSIFPVR